MMRVFWAVVRKEWMEQIRAGRVLLFLILFFLFGVMNPAVAKLTPWLLEVMAESLAESGMTVSAVTVDAMTSWVQFFKNIPMALIVFVIVESSIFTREYEKGTLIMPLTKGLARWNLVLAKTGVLTVLWTAGYWLCFAVTYGYNAYFWDNSIAQNLWFAVVCWWLFGLWTVMLTVLFSTFASSGGMVLLGVGAVNGGSYLLTLFPKIASFSPAFLMNTGVLMTGAEEPSSYTASLLITIGICAASFVLSIPLFNRKSI